MNIIIQTALFDIGHEIEELRRNHPAIGALVAFTGWVRDINEGQEVEGLYLEHYPGMAEQEIGRIIQQAQQRWPLEGVRVIHRVGDLKPGDPIVLVLVAGQHRGEAFAACEFIMDYLKTQAPFWKKESHGQGSSRWLEAKESDKARLTRWNLPIG